MGIFLPFLSSEYKGALDLDFLPIPQRCSAGLSSHPALLLFCPSRLQQWLGQSRCSGGVVRDVCVWVLILGSFVRKMPHQNDEAQPQSLEHPLHPFESGQDTVPFFGGALSPVSPSVWSTPHSSEAFSPCPLKCFRNQLIMSTIYGTLSLKHIYAPGLVWVFTVAGINDREHGTGSEGHLLFLSPLPSPSSLCLSKATPSLAALAFCVLDTPFLYFEWDR